MRDGNVIEVNDVHKKFKNYFDKSNNLKEKVLHKERNKYQEHWVLQGISFQVKKGEAVGLIGCNGCGKSTTLKLLTKIIYPDKGNIEIKGRVSSLLELGAGFHPDLSGYENIYLNAAVFGLSRKEIDNRVDDIIRFSELREFIDNPIRTYSSGMYMKLAFSVAINVDADILLIDEILGVGDVSFQKKCFEKLMEIKKKGTTIIIVSHSTDQIERICDRSIWIEKGKIRQEGNPKEVHENYLDVMEDRRLIRKQKEEEEKKRIEEEKKRKAEEKRKKEERKRFEQERKRKEQKAKEQIEKVNLLGKEQRNQEREELENRKKQRELLRKSNSGELQIEKEKQQQIQQNFQERELEELEKQKKLIESAENERRKQQIVQEGFKLEEIPEEEIWVEYYKKETNRLQLVVDEKNLEIERLDSVIRQKDLLMEKNDTELKAEVARLENVVTEKEDEADRLNEVIIEKNEEIDRLNVTIMEKDLEIERINALLIRRDD